MSFHGTALRAEGAADDEIAAAREFDPDRMGFSEKERELFDFAMTANGDPHSIADEDVERLRELGVTDSELVETLETVNTGNNFNLISDALKLTAEDFLTYEADE